MRRFVSGGCDNLVKTWRFEASEGRWVEEAKLEAHSDWVRDVAWAPAIGSNRSVIATCSQVTRSRIICLMAKLVAEMLRVLYLDNMIFTTVCKFMPVKKAGQSFIST